MNKPSQTPWIKTENFAEGPFYIYSKPTGEKVELTEANAAHIVKCVNMHDELIEALKEAIEFAPEGSLRRQEWVELLARIAAKS